MPSAGEVDLDIVLRKIHELALADGILVTLAVTRSNGCYEERRRCKLRLTDSMKSWSGVVRVLIGPAERRRVVALSQNDEMTRSLRETLESAGAFRRRRAKEFALR